MNTLDLIKGYKRNSDKYKGVKCIESGEVWDSIRDCSNTIGLAHSNVCKYLANGKPWKGLHFEYIK